MHRGAAERAVRKKDPSPTYAEGARVASLLSTYRQIVPPCHLLSSAIRHTYSCYGISRNAIPSFLSLLNYTIRVYNIRLEEHCSDNVQVRRANHTCHTLLCPAASQYTQVPLIWLFKLN